MKYSVVLVGLVLGGSVAGAVAVVNSKPAPTFAEQVKRLDSLNLEYIDASAELRDLEQAKPLNDGAISVASDRVAELELAIAKQGAKVKASLATGSEADRKRFLGELK